MCFIGAEIRRNPEIPAAQISRARMETGRELPFHWAAPENLEKEIETRGNRVKLTNISLKAALHRVQDGEFKVLVGISQIDALYFDPKQ